MKGYIAFVKKEFVENLKNYRFLILFAIFAIFGMSSAFLAKFTPEIISAFGAGLEITEEPTALDAWQQFYKNISGIGFALAGNKRAGKAICDFGKVHRSGSYYDG